MDCTSDSRADRRRFVDYVIGVLYLGVFSDSTIKKFIRPNTVNAQIK